MTEYVGAAPYGRAEVRNGHKPRILRTRVGTLNLLVFHRTGRGPSPLASSPATNETRRRLSWRSCRCTSRVFPGRLQR
jgi:hypothetical protein